MARGLTALRNALWGCGQPATAAATAAAAPFLSGSTLAINSFPSSSVINTASSTHHRNLRSSINVRHGAGSAGDGGDRALSPSPRDLDSEPRVDSASPQSIPWLHPVSSVTGTAHGLPRPSVLTVNAHAGATATATRAETADPNARHPPTWVQEADPRSCSSSWSWSGRSLVGIRNGGSRADAATLSYSLSTATTGRGGLMFLSARSSTSSYTSSPQQQRQQLEDAWMGMSQQSGGLVRHLHGSRYCAAAAAAAAGGGGDDDAGNGPARRTTGFRDVGLGAPMEVFDRPLKALHRDRSARLLDSSDPLHSLVSERLLDRLEDCRRNFPTVVVLGGAALPVLRQLAGGRAGIERVVVVDSSDDMLARVKREEAESRLQLGAKPWPRVLCVRGDEEHLPLRPGSVDLIISCLGLHWANDLPGAMAQCRRALVSDGLFLAALFGGDTLQELRISCALAQMEREGGVSAVVSPLAQVRDAGNLLTRADLRLPAVDVDRFTLGYPSPWELVEHLRALGEGNATSQRRRALSRDSALAAAAVYQSMFGGDQEGTVTATYEVIFMTGWAPAAHQPKAAQRGSATVSFQDLADGLVQGGKAVGGTAEGEVITPPPPTLSPPAPPSKPQ